MTRTAFEYPRHRATGIAFDRLLMLLAVMNRHARDWGSESSRSYDVFVNAVGGLRLDDPGSKMHGCTY